MADKTKPVFSEVAAAGQGISVNGWVDEIARPDDTVLKSLGWDMSHYRRLLRDDQVKSTFQQRIDATISAEWTVEPGGPSARDKAAAAFITEHLAAMPFDAICKKMLYGSFYGYAVAECLWGREGGRIVPEDIRVRKAKRFRFGRDGGLRLITRNTPTGVIMPERKFWVLTVQADSDDDPYGPGLAHWLYWPVFLKRNAIKFWAIALEKFGAPTAKGTYPPGAQESEVRKLLEALQAIATDAAVAIPQGMEAQLIEATRSAGGDHVEFCKYMDAMIAKIILSQTATTEIGPWRGTAEVQKDVRDEIIKADADLLCESFNAGPVRWLTDWNFPGAAAPKIWRDITRPEDLRIRALRDKIVHDMGFRPSKRYIEETYGGEWELRDGEATEAFAEADAPDHDDLLDRLEGMIQADGPAEQIRRALVDAESYAEAEAALLGLSGGLGVDAGQVLAEGFTVARLSGEADGT